MPTAKIEISYLDLAKEAKSRGDMNGVWRAFKQHARMMRKKKANASTVAPRKTFDVVNIPRNGA